MPLHVISTATTLCVQERAHHCTRRTALLNTFKHVSCCHV